MSSVTIFTCAGCSGLNNNRGGATRKLLPLQLKTQFRWVCKTSNRRKVCCRCVRHVGGSELTDNPPQICISRYHSEPSAPKLSFPLAASAAAASPLAVREIGTSHTRQREVVCKWKTGIGKLAKPQTINPKGHAEPNKTQPRWLQNKPRRKSEEEKWITLPEAEWRWHDKILSLRVLLPPP